MHLWHDIEPGDSVPDIVNVIVEIPKGSQNKYEYDKDKNIIKLDRVLFSPLHYPGDYGIIPRTLADDGDPLDALVLLSNPTYPGVLIEAIPIGLLRMIDSGMNDDKLLCVAKYDPRYSKFFLGIPGALLLASGLSIVLNFAEYLMPILFIILGSIFIVRAFDVDRAIINFTRSSSPSSFIRVFSLLAGIMIILAGINAGYVSAISFVGSNNNSNDILNILLNRHIIASFITNMLPLLWIGLGVIFGGHLLSDVFKSNARLLSDSLRLVVLGLFYIPAQQMVNMIEGEVNPFTLISSLLLGLAITLIAATLVYEYYRKKSNSSILPSNSNKSNNYSH